MSIFAKIILLMHSCTLLRNLNAACIYTFKLEVVLCRNWGTDTTCQSEDGFISKEDDSSDFYPNYVFHIYLGKKSQPGMYSSWITSW